MSWNLLIVEDDDDIAVSLADVFEARGYHVLRARHGREAIEVTGQRAFRPDAILLDMLMPVMDGATFLKERASAPLIATAPVIVMTAQPRYHAGEEQVFARMAKPLDLRTLLETIDRACHGGPPSIPARS